MKPRRGVDFRDCDESAGTIESRNGNATATPVPRRKVRRESAFFVMNIGRLLTCALLSFETERFSQSRSPMTRMRIYQGLPLARSDGLPARRSIAGFVPEHTS